MRRKGVEDVRNQSLNLGPGFGWEVALGVHLPKGVAEHAAACKHSSSSPIQRVADQCDAALPARTLFRCAGQGLAEEGEVLVGKGFGQNIGVVLNQVEDQPVFPCAERRGGNESGLSGEGGGLPDDETCLPAETRATKVLRPVEARGVGDEVFLLPGVVRLVNVVLIRQGNMFFGDVVLQFNDMLGTDAGVAEASQLEQSGNVRLIFGADVTHAVAVGKVVFAVGHFQAALQQVGGIVLGVVKAGGDPQSEKVRGMKAAAVQGIDIRPEALAQSPRQFVLVADGSDGVELWAERSEAFGLDGGLVHIGVIEVGNFAGIRTSRRVGFGCFFDEPSDTLLAQIEQGVEDSNVATVGGDFGALDPVAVRVVVEIVAGLDRAVQVSDDNAMNFWCARFLRMGNKREEGKESVCGDFWGQEFRCKSHEFCSKRTSNFSRMTPDESI